MIHSLNKGKAGEREWALWLNQNLQCNARRGVQYQGGPDSPDIVDKAIPCIHWETKRVEKLNLSLAMAQAVKDAGTKIPVLSHRKNREGWLVTLRAEDLKSFSLLLQNHLSKIVANDK